jgi:hypothetical protein
MLGHLRFHTGVFLPLPDDALSERSRRAWAGERSGSSPWSLRSSFASNGVSSVVRLEVWLCREREERVDFWDVGRELGVRVEPHGSGVSIAAMRRAVQGLNEGAVKRRRGESDSRHTSPG